MSLRQGDDTVTGRLAYMSWGLRHLAPEMRVLSGLDPVFSPLGPGAATALGGWGHKPTAARARRIAAQRGLPYLAFEDGFLRSLKPGDGQRPASMILDRTGIYYDARQPSDLETMLATADFTPEETSAATRLLGLIASHRLSKYNHGREAPLAPDAAPMGKPLVLLIDQTLGDESVAGALADAETFRRMAEAAVEENPDATVAARLHPETVSGAKRGYLPDVAQSLGLPIIAEPLSPWSLLDRRPKVYTVSSQFGFEALLAGCDVACFGLPFYAGWGLTDDRQSSPRRGRRRSAAELAAAAFLRYCHYFDCWRRTPIDAETAVDQLAFLRRSYLGNARPVVGYRIAWWKQKAVAAMCDGPAGKPVFTRNLGTAKALARSCNAAIAAWGIDAVRLRPQLKEEGLAVTAVEDGFIRSVGLGAAFVTPLSLVFDASGLYYDPTGASDIETMLREDTLTADDLARAATLRGNILARRITKYNVAAVAPDIAISPGRAVVLVPGQVADDWAVLIGRPAELPINQNVNKLLLERARIANPEALVIFKPHPDVEHLGRAGAVDEADTARLADFVAHRAPIDDLIQLSERVETYSSLAGFEALLRGKSVAVHGQPFYAGWGLTEDRVHAPRRGRQRCLDELAAIALIRYPRYWDPESGLVCPPEVALHRIAEASASGRRSGSWTGIAVGKTVILARRLRRRLKGSKHDA